MSTVELLVDTKKDTKALVVPPAVQVELPTLGEAFKEADENYLNDPENYLRQISDNVFSFEGPGGAEVTASLLYDDRSKDDEILIIFAPFSDVAPKSNYKEMYHYTRLEAPSFIDKQRAQPNSWNQITKSSAVFELMAALNEGLPVLTIFSPISLRAHERSDRRKFSNGDFSPASKIVRQAVDYAQDIMHGRRSETRLTRAHIHGASLGAHNAIGAANELSHGRGDIQVLTVTAQELIMGPRNLAGLADGFLVRNNVGEPSNETAPLGSLFIAEPALRRAIDSHGNELAMLPRMINAMMKIPYLAGITRPEIAEEAVENLEDAGVPVTVALAENSRLTKDSAGYLPARTDVIKVKAMAGEKIGHIADEHVGLTAAVTAMGLKKAGKIPAGRGKIPGSEV